MFNILVATLGVLVFMLITVVVISLGIGKEIVFIPAGGDADIKKREPVYFEWTGRELIMHPEQFSLELERDVGQIRSWEATYRYLNRKIAGTPFEALLDSMQDAAPNRYLIIVVRPGGFHNFLEIKGYFQHRGIDIGYEPLDANTDFSGGRN
jgi:hypothetical protein